MPEEHVILVDESDAELGTEEKLAAHRRGLLHRAVSVFLVDDRGRTLLQRRAANKYHSGGRWANACCSHPRPGEDAAAAARRRLAEEMGIDCELEFVARFQYRSQVEDDLIEHELDHVFLGRFDGTPTPNPDEVDGWAWRDLGELDEAVERSPDEFALWFPKVLRLVRDSGALRGA
ncbi:MAG: isopentenyl-diphosphate Delta-isomerase [Planctomycetota bacterium]